MSLRSSPNSRTCSSCLCKMQLVHTQEDTIIIWSQGATEDRSRARAKCPFAHACRHDANAAASCGVGSKYRSLGILGVSQNYGYLFGGPYNKDYSILESILGYPNFGKLPPVCHRSVIKCSTRTLAAVLLLHSFRPRNKIKPCRH